MNTPPASPLCPPAPHLITRPEACRLFGIQLRTWTEWERTGRVPRGRLAPTPGCNAKRMVYPLDELQTLRDQLATQYDPYPDPDRPGCYRLPLVSEKYPGQAIIDADSLPLVQGRRWNWAPGHRPGQGSVVASGRDQPTTPLRQLIMGVVGRANPVSHLNGDPRDLRRENLIVRTPAQVRAACPKNRSRGGRACSSPYKGVTWKPSDQKWAVMIAAEGKAHSLGQYKTELAAAVAYDRAARDFYGQHATLNFPHGPDPEALRQANEIEAYDPPFPPPGHVTRRDACRMFGVGFHAWLEWERKGRVTCGRFVNNPRNLPGRSKVYPLDELHRLLDEFNRIGKPYPDPTLPGVHRVPIRSWMHKLEALIDTDDLPLIEGKHWNWGHRGNAKDGDVILATIERPQTPLDRVITGAKGFHDRVMHLNHDPLDCRRCNLIVRTPAEQMFATRKMGSVSGRQYTSTFKGVSWDEPRGKWKAPIVKEHRNKYLGRFDSETEAAEAYDNAARTLFGDHAHLNFPPGPNASPQTEALARAA